MTSDKKATMAAFAWLILMLVLTAFWTNARLDDSYQGDHSMVSSGFSIIARNLAEGSYFATDLTPIAENPPFGDDIYYYIHWPPLFPILLGIQFRIFGVSDFAAQLFMQWTLFVNVFLIFLILKRQFGLMEASIGSMIYLASPIMLKFGIFVLVKPLASEGEKNGPNPHAPRG